MSVLLRLLRVAAAWAFTAFFGGAMLLAVILTIGLVPQSLLRDGLRWWGRNILGILGARLELLNPSTLEGQASRVLIFNHQSALDMMWMAAIMPPAPLALGKKELAYIPFVNLAWWALRFTLIDRAHPRKVVEGFKEVARLIAEEKRSLVISPEGTRSPTGEFLPFKRGAFQIAIRSQAPLFPVIVSGAYELLPKQSFLPKPGVVRLSFLPPIETRGLAESDAGDLAARAREVMLRAYEEQRKRP